MRCSSDSSTSALQASCDSMLGAEELAWSGGPSAKGKSNWLFGSEKDEFEVETGACNDVDNNCDMVVRF